IANSLPAQLCLPPGEITCQPSPGATVCCLLLHVLHSPEEAFLKTSPSTAGLMHTHYSSVHTHTHTHTHTLTNTHTHTHTYIHTHTHTHTHTYIHTHTHTHTRTHAHTHTRAHTRAH